MEGVVINTLPAIKCKLKRQFQKFARVIKESLSRFGEDAFGGFKKGLTSSLDVSISNRS
jgi:hypothetical protein